jgi:2'-5' RNA ligase
MRMFYAIKFENHIKEELAKNLAEIKKHTLRGNFTKKENFHITLVFVGETEAGKIKDLIKASDNTAVKLNPFPVKITIDGLGTFARPGDELLWAGVITEPENILGVINKTITEKLAEFGIKLNEKSNFHPHVTMARKTEFYEASSKAIAKIKFAPIEFTVNSITLMESVQEITTYGERSYSQIVYKPVHETKF